MGTSTVISEKSSAGNFVVNFWYDSVFFIFPFWFSVLYYLALHLFQQFEGLLFLLTYICLAETHFASTWFMFFDSKLRIYFSKRWIIFYLVPALIMIYSILSVSIIPIGPLIGMAMIFSAIHVTGQSFGFVNLYRNLSNVTNKNRRQFDRNLIYAGAAFFLGIGFYRLFLNNEFFKLTISPFPIELFSVVRFLALFWIVGSGMVAIFSLKAIIRDEKRNPEASVWYWIVLLYSAALYSPYCFVTRPEHAVAMGVGIHFIQYLGITWHLNKNKSKRGNEIISAEPIYNWIFSAPLNFIVVVLLYAFLMALIRQGELTNFNLELNNRLYALVIGLQMVHYHVDSFIWRFSVPEVRNQIVPYLKKH